jgi:hypothetical protein
MPAFVRNCILPAQGLAAHAFLGVAMLQSMNLRHFRLSPDLSRPLLASLVGTLVLTAIGCQRTGAPPPQWNDAVVMEIESWRAGHEESYTRNWATIEGLHFLKDGAQSAGSAPDNDVVLTASLPEHLGTFTVAPDEVTFDPEPGAPITINGETPASAMVLRDDSADEADVIEANGATVVVHRSGKRVSLRVRIRTASVRGASRASTGFRSVATITSSVASLRMRRRATCRSSTLSAMWTPTRPKASSSSR